MSVSLNLKKPTDDTIYPSEVKKTKLEESIDSIIEDLHKQALSADVSQATGLLKKCQGFKKEDLYDKKNLSDFIQSIYCLPRNPALLKDNHIYSLTYNTGESKILELKECACIDASRISNASSNALGLRSQFEYEIIKKIEKHHADRKLSDKPLQLMSFGCGGCLSEWMVAAQLILIGYTHLELHLIDRDFSSELRKNKLKQFLEQFPNVNISVASYSTLEKFGEKNIPCDVAYALDLDRTKLTDSLVKIRFSPNGFTYVSKCSPHWDVKDASISYKLTS